MPGRRRFSAAVDLRLASGRVRWPEVVAPDVAQRGRLISRWPTIPARSAAIPVKLTPAGHAAVSRTGGQLAVVVSAVHRIRGRPRGV